jgi:adenylylsulfate kinase-like enzyme
VPAIPNPHIYWITGLPGTGKSTLAKWLYDDLRNKGIPVVWLDGDVMREELFQEFGYDLTDRYQLALKYHHLTKIISSQGISVIVSTVSLFEEIHMLNRDAFPHYSEIFLEMSQDLLEEGPRRNQYFSEDSNQSPRTISQKPINPSLHLYAESLTDRHNWVSELEKYLETI